MIKKVIVTGANGFLGKALCKELSNNGVQVIAVVRDELDSRELLEDTKNVRVYHEELSNYDKLPFDIADRDVDVFFHLAWTGSAGPLRRNAEVQLDNVRYTCDAVRVCGRMQCKKFVFASSIMEYEIEKLMQIDKKPPLSTLYSSGKVAADYMARTIAGDLGIAYVRAVISNIYGPGEVSPRLINTSLRKMLSGEHCSFSSGEQMYDFIYIDDAAKAFAALGSKGKPDKTYYIGSLSPKPLKEYLIEMRDQVDSTIKLGLGDIPFNGASLSYTEFDIESVWKDTGFVPQVTFKEGIKRTIEWIKNENSIKENGFEFVELELKGAFYLSYFSIVDNRGGFAKLFEKKIFKMGGIDFKVDETFASASAKGVIRGIHFQSHCPQAKIVSVLRGKVWDVIVDLRPNSPTYKRWLAYELSAEKHNALFIPRGFGHGFVALEEDTIMLYQCNGEYKKEYDTGIRFDDLELNIEWPINESDAIHSSRDLSLMSFDEYNKNPMHIV